LTVEQFLEAGLDTGRQPEPGQVIGHLDFDEE
jgi:hypothetical protein